MEREFREASDMRPSVIGLSLVLAVAAILRFWAIGGGIPFAPGADEPQIMNRVVTMMRTGNFNPHFFDYPALYIYLQLAVACVQFILGASAGAWSSLSQVTPDDFYFWGRVVTAVLGVATVYLVYLIGSRWGSRHALLAAGLIAVLPNHVRESHYILTDVPMTFFTTLSFLLALRALEKQTVAAFAWAGAAAGLAAATKYYGILVLMAPLLATFFVPNTVTARLRMGLVALVAAIGCFLLAAPYTILDLPGFLEGYGRLSGALHGRTPNVQPGWVTYLKHLHIGLSVGAEGWKRTTGYGAMLLLLWGLIHGVVRAITGPGKGRFVLLVTFPLVYFVMVSDRALIYARYLMPIFPFVALLIAIAVVSGVTLLRRFNVPRTARTSAIAVLTLVAIVPAAIASVGWDLAHARRSTYEQAYDWIRQNVPADAGVVIETANFALPPRYRSINVQYLTDRDYDTYVAEGIKYALLSGQASGSVFDDPQIQPAQTAAYRRMLARMLLVKAFKRSNRDLGPDLRIYKLVDEAPRKPAVVPTGQPGR